MYVLIFNHLGYSVGDFFTISSGHPVCISSVAVICLNVSKKLLQKNSRFEKFGVEARGQILSLTLHFGGTGRHLFSFI
jgi:hypothetical protein